MRPIIRIAGVTLIAAAGLLGLAETTVASSISISSCKPTFTAGKAGATYTVKAALTAGAGADCIHVTAPGVTIDLGGFTLTGKPKSGTHPTGIVILPKAAGALITTTTTGGSITGFATGIVDEASSARIENLSVADNTTTGIEIMGTGSGSTPFVDGSVVADNIIDGNGNYGVYMQDTIHCMVDRNNQISDSADIGVWIKNTASAAVLADNVVSWNQLNEIGGTRIEVGYTGVPSTCSTIAGASAGNIIANNSVPFDPGANSLYGIGVECDSAVEDTVYGNDVGSGAGTADDLFDGNTSPPCDSDRWAGNTFASSNQSCIN